MNNILCILIGYIIGSISPAYIIGRLYKIDIRKKGRKYAGTINVYKVLGLLPAIPTAIFDTLKGIISIFIARLIGADFVFSQLSGFAAILGHIFPFYIKFRGGQGVACATGILLYYLYQYFNVLTLIDWAILIFALLIFTFITKNGEIFGLILLPLLNFITFFRDPANSYNLFLLILSLFIIGVGIYNIVTRKLIVIKDTYFRTHWWRTAFRPGAVAFIIFYLIYGKKITLIIIGIVMEIFLLTDIIRFLSKKSNELLTQKVKRLFKKTEEKTFSSMTLFLIGAFITILLFPAKISMPVLTYLIFGDILGKIVGLSFGRHKIFNKTLEGSLGYLTATFICAYILYLTLSYPLSLLLLGAFTATIVELLPIAIDDNFTVPVITGTVMYLL